MPAATHQTRPVRQPSIGITPFDGEELPNSHAQSQLEWNPWPDGEFHADYSRAAAEESNNLMMHWAHRTSSSCKGVIWAEKWEKGKVSTRKCLGIIACDVLNCEYIVRTQTHPLGINRQLEEPCECGAELLHYPCGIICKIWTWRGGIHVWNSGFHAHPRPPRVRGRY